MDYKIRKMKPAEYPLLEDFLYEAIFQKDNAVLLPKTIINDPALQIYVKGFGCESNDFCLCAEAGGQIVGAVWVRTIPGYGRIDDSTPEFSISLYPAYRGLGVGTALMKQMLTHLKNAGYQKASLSVQKDNYAVKMYLKLGFQTVRETPKEYIMVYYFH